MVEPLHGWTVIYEPTGIHRKSNHYISTRREKCLQNIICTVTYVHSWKLGHVLKNKYQGEMALRKNKPCCYFCDIKLPCILYSKLLIAPLSVKKWRSLSWKSRSREQFKNFWTAPWKFSEWIYTRLRIIWRTRSRATQESSEGIYRRRRFYFVNSSWNIPTPLWFLRNPLREWPEHLDLYNTLPSENYNWNSSGLQLTQKKTRPAKTRFVCTIPFSDQLLAGSINETWQLIRRQQIKSIVCRPVREKKTEIWFFNIWSDK